MSFKRRNIRDRREEEEFLKSVKSYQEDHAKNDRAIKLDSSQSIKLMLRGAVFFVMMLVLDVGLRKYRYTGTTMETVFLVLFLMSAVGTLQLPVGLYFLIKNMWKEVPTNKKGR